MKIIVLMLVAVSVSIAEIYPPLARDECRYTDRHNLSLIEGYAKPNDIVFVCRNEYDDHFEFVIDPDLNYIAQGIKSEGESSVNTVLYIDSYIATFYYYNEEGNRVSSKEMQSSRDKLQLYYNMIKDHFNPKHKAE